MKHMFVLLSVLLASGSSCPDGELKCPLSSDFKTDRKNGKDEDIWGLCDFERHSCGWNDTSDTSYSWRREMANITSVPGKDHTTGSPSGYVMHVDGKEGGMFPTATLEFSVNKLAAPACQISFWYHIYDNQSTSSSTFILKMVRGDTERILLKISESKTDGWANAKVFLGNQPAGYKLHLSFEKPYYNEGRHVMVDDISFENCREGEVPAGSDQLTCDFKKDICSWYHDYTASLLWEMSDELTGEGHYMLITASSNLDISSAARLVSLPQNPSQVICVNFLYRIFGSNIGSLKFISKHPGEEETVVWMRSGTQGNKWRFADLTFNSDKPIQFIIEAVVGGDQQGSIAIDNIQVYSNETGSCPAERECTFQGSLCGMKPQPSTNFTWGRMSGASQPANYSGPATDHTLETEQGYYLSAQLWSHPVGSRVAVMTAEMEPTPPDGECLMFWYHMEGSEVGELGIYLQTADDHRPPAYLWTRSGDQGKRWRHGRVTLRSSISYQVVFEAVVGSGLKKDIAIDDLTVLNGACPPPGFCDFEMDFCGWVNNPPAGSGVDWDWLSGGAPGRFVPGKDHSTDSSLGHFAILQASESNTEYIAQLESETMGPVDQACLEMWHHADGWSEDNPSYITLTVFVSETAGMRPVWNTNGYMNDTWIKDRVDYSATGPHQIILQAVHPDTKLGGGFSLDDIHIILGESCNEISPTTTPNPATTTSAPPSPMDCTFEEGLCSWIQEVGDDLNWTLSSGLEVDKAWDGPQYDHSVGNEQGSFLLLNGSGSKDGERAVVSVPVTSLTSQICVGFWYYILGPSVSTLDLLVETESSEELFWTRRGTQNPEWIQAQVTISRKTATRLMFSGRRNTNSKGFIAIDDVTVREGACSDHISDVCGFESSWCGFANSVDHWSKWIRERGTKYEVDHTYRTENGVYLTVMASNSTQTEEAQLLTPELTSDTEMCVRFWYWLPAGPSGSLSVHVLRSGDLDDALWRRSGAPSPGWEVAEVTVSSPAKFRVVFSAVHAPGSNSTVKLDDISVRGGACDPPGSCDFESGQCTWFNIPKEDGHEWVIARGGYQGPPTDQTQTPDGHFLLSSALHQSHSSVAQVLSEWIQLKDTTSCLTLWYHMDSSDSGTLRVYLHSGLSEGDLMFNSTSSGGSWTRFSQTVERNNTFQLLIEAESNNRGFIAVDDISITPGLCQVNETSSGFVGCTFENGPCGWEDISVGQCEWMRGRNASENTGPSVDNTVGTELGWYMSVNTGEGVEKSPAALQSPTMKQASTTCTLNFYYNMYGDDIEDLNVVLKEGSRRTTLWWLSGGHGDLWRHDEVNIGRVPQEFTILLEASRSFNRPGHIAIDDIDFTNCTLPEPQPSCPDDMFTCNNSACVQQNQVCDFSDDCGDWSDEIDCEQQGFVERCSFEQGLCFWAGSDVDTSGVQWTLHRGEDIWPEHGPNRDHTQNSAAGHFAIPGTHLSENGQMSEILSKTLLPSSTCTVRFFFFSLDDAAAALTARLRTRQSGGDDIVLWVRNNTQQSYSWQRAEVTFSYFASSKIVFRYERGSGPKGLIALDDISFSKECVFDPDNNKLPDTSPTSAPPTPSNTPTSPATASTPSNTPTSPATASTPSNTPTSPATASTPSNTPTSPATASTSTTPTNPCQDNEFFCWRSAGKVCILAALQCDYHPDCPQGEDEDDCGPCTFESDQCQWTDTSDGQSRWRRQKASNDTEPPTDHTTETGYYMTVNFSQVSEQSEARLQSPPLAPTSPYCQILFHFHISAESAGSLRVLMQQAGGSEAILWSRSHNTVSDWTPEQLPLGLIQQPFKLWFSSINKVTQADPAGDRSVAVDDISFLNCGKSYVPPAPSACGCSFEDGLCVWVQGAEDELIWLSRSGPTETPNTGPAGDHTTGRGKYLYIESSLPSVRGNMAQLKSPLLPPAGENGYCFTFWHHMFGATVGSLRVILQTADPLKKTPVWQKSGNQGDEWQQMQIHVTVQKVHQVILEATVGGEAGDIAIDDISIISGPCPASDICDFEEGSCNWQQETTDDFDWVRQSGFTLNPNTGPDSDHTTNTPTGHYYFLSSSTADRIGQTAEMFSPLYPAARGACVQLWYHMYGKEMGTLNVYQQSEDTKRDLIFSQIGDQGRLWRLAQASLLPRDQPYRIVVEGVKSGPTHEGDMAFDDVEVTDAQCPPYGHCDFETNMCSWSNLGGGVDEQDWLRGTGASRNPNTGPSVDHTTNSTDGHYLYVDSSVGQWGDTSFLISEVFQPSARGHCLKFWYHMYGDHVGTLRVYMNDREMHAAGNEEGDLKWIESGNRGDMWQEASVTVKHKEAFWRGSNPAGDVALDDIAVLPGGCYSGPPIDPPGGDNDMLSTGLAVGLTLLVGVIIVIVLFVLNRRRSTINQQTIVSSDALNQNSTFDLFDCKIDGTQHGTQSDFSFFNNLYDPSSGNSNGVMASSDA